MSSVSTGVSSSISIKAVEASVPMPTLKPCETDAPLYLRCSISQRWLNWCSAPDAGRLDCVACIAKPLSSKPSASCSTLATLPARTPAGSQRASFSPSCTTEKANSSSSSEPTASASIQSAPAGIFAIRSAYPDADIFAGAAAAIVGSSTMPSGAGQSKVCLLPSLVIEAP